MASDKILLINELKNIIDFMLQLEIKAWASCYYLNQPHTSWGLATKTYFKDIGL